MLGARGGLLERDFGFGVVRQLLEVGDARARAARGRPGGAADPLSERPTGRWTAASPRCTASSGRSSTSPRSGRCCSPSTTCSGPTGRRCGLLAYLARRIEDLPMLVLATIRTGEPDVDEDLLGAMRQPPARVSCPAR